MTMDLDETKVWINEQIEEAADFIKEMEGEEVMQPMILAAIGRMTTLEQLLHEINGTEWV